MDTWRAQLGLGQLQECAWHKARSQHCGYEPGHSLQKKISKSACSACCPAAGTPRLPPYGCLAPLDLLACTLELEPLCGIHRPPGLALPAAPCSRGILASCNPGPLGLVGGQPRNWLGEGDFLQHLDMDLGQCVNRACFAMLWCPVYLHLRVKEIFPPPFQGLLRSHRQNLKCQRWFSSDSIFYFFLVAVG